MKSQRPNAPRPAFSPATAKTPKPTVRSGEKATAADVATKERKASGDNGSDGWQTVTKSRRPSAPAGPGGAIAPPSGKFAPKIPFGDGQRFLKKLPAGATRTRWAPAAEAIHERKHGKASIQIGAELCATPVDGRHPAFQDPKSGDIYRFDTARGHIAITTSTGDIKSCYPKDENGFRRAALVTQYNTSSMSYEELASQGSGRHPTTSGQPSRTLRDGILDRALKRGIPL